MEEELQYMVTFDAEGNSLQGANTYKFHLSPEIPAKNFWSVIVYDKQNRLIIRTDQKWPSVFSSCQNLVINHDGSVDIWFGPKFPNENNCNFIMTNPGYGWIMILRLYGPTESWFDKSWKPGEIEKIRKPI